MKELRVKYSLRNPIYLFICYKWIFFTSQFCNSQLQISLLAMLSVCRCLYNLLRLASVFAAFQMAACFVLATFFASLPDGDPRVHFEQSWQDYIWNYFFISIDVWCIADLRMGVNKQQERLLIHMLSVYEKSRLSIKNGNTATLQLYLCLWDKPSLTKLLVWLIQ